MRFLRGAGIVAAAAVTVALAACTAAPPSPTPVAAATTAASAPSPSPAPARVVISAESIAVLDAAGKTLESFDYSRPADEVVAALTGVFGSAPVDSASPAHNDSPATTSHAWGEFTLVDGNWNDGPPHYPSLSVQVGAAEVDGIPITTLDGIQVGASAEQVARTHPEDVLRHADPETGTEDLTIRVGMIELPPLDDVASPNLAVLLRAPDASGAITFMRAPSPNWGA